MKKNKTEIPENRNLSRADFVKSTAMIGGGAFLLSQFGWADNLLAKGMYENPQSPGEYDLHRAEHFISSSCLQCNTGCGIKVKIKDGVAVKIEGNPYTPFNMTPSINYSTSLRESEKLEGVLCPKGQAGIQTAYDPYRIVKVLKRDGKRGENKWKTVPFDQAVEEIASGGKLFAHVLGEENRTVEGMKDLYAIKDAAVLADMAKAVEGIFKKKTKEEKQKVVEKFKADFADYLHLMIDPDHPDLGPKNNQFSFVWGRLKAGRKELISRFVTDSFGSTNAHGHTTVCQGSLYFTGKALSDTYTNGKFTNGKKAYWQVDTLNTEFLISFGTAYIEGGYGPTHNGQKLMKRLAEKKLKMVVVDPRFSKAAAKANKWIPVKPGTDSALVMGMIQVIINSKKYDANFLTAANQAAANAAGELTFTNLTWLVKEDGSLLKASEINLKAAEKRCTADNKAQFEFEYFVAMKDGQPIAVDPYDKENAVVGDLDINTTVNGIKVKSGFQMIADSANSMSLEKYAEICEVPVSDIKELANEFTKYGKKAAADLHRGVSQHTTGFYNVLAIYTLNALIGNFDWKGGMLYASAQSVDGSKEGNPFNLKKDHPSPLKPFGISSIRHETKYEDTTIFAGYPAKRQWFPMASDIYQEIFPSIHDQYPYPTKVLISYMAAAPYSLPGGNNVIDTLIDVEKLPLFIASDIVIGEMSMYADYIFPDVSYLERWEFHGSHPTIAQKTQPVRTPVIAPLTDTVTVFGQEMPISLEALLFGLAEKLNLPGFGLQQGLKCRNFIHSDDLYIAMVANLAAGDKPGDEVPDADDEEVKIFLESRKHLPKHVFDAERWSKIVGEKWWRKVIYVLNRGGRFQDYAKAYDGEKLKNKYGTFLNLYVEKAAKTKSAITGKKYAAVATAFPQTNSLGKEMMDEKEGFDLHLITFRDIHFTKSRSIADQWLTAIKPENNIVVNSVDAKRLNIKDDDLVKVVSKSNPNGEWDLKNGRKKPMIGKVQVIEGIKPGVIGFCLGFGHWAAGSSDTLVDGSMVKGDPRRATGIHCNAAMRLDDHMNTTSLHDPVGASVAFYDTKVRLVKI
ncbi:MAG: molybdopterin-dependent oxidoreductase [Ignavibacteriales bacterium]|nr:molybdopterin-dependent oxidoreductase [Ignavibacteriales bacterium]